VRAIAFVALLILAGLSVAVGSFHLALALAAVKAVIVGLVYMDLRHAHRAHAIAFAGGVSLLLVVVGLVGG
jgi:hypothetical protein